MRWLADIVVIGVRVTMFTIVLAWVAIGHVKPAPASQTVPANKGAKPSGDEASRGTHHASA